MNEFIKLFSWLFLVFSFVAESSEIGAKSSNDQKYDWLESLNSPAVKEWVKKRNEQSLLKLRQNPNYADFKKKALELLQSTDKIPEPEIIGDFVYIFGKMLKIR